MATDLNIKKCWFHNKEGKWHYDIPKTRIQEIQKQCEVVSSKTILKIIQGYDPAS